jgi:hypothetical protein
MITEVFLSIRAIRKKRSAMAREQNSGTDNSHTLATGKADYPTAKALDIIITAIFSTKAIIIAGRITAKENTTSKVISCYMTVIGNGERETDMENHSIKMVKLLTKGIGAMINQMETVNYMTQTENCYIVVSLGMVTHMLNQKHLWLNRKPYKCPPLNRKHLCLNRKLKWNKCLKTFQKNPFINSYPHK